MQTHWIERKKIKTNRERSAYSKIHNSHMQWIPSIAICVANVHMKNKFTRFREHTQRGFTQQSQYGRRLLSSLFVSIERIAQSMREVVIAWILLRLTESRVKALPLLKCVARRRQRLFTYIRHAEHTIIIIMCSIPNVNKHAFVSSFGDPVAHLPRDQQLHNTHAHHRDMHERVWCVRDDTFQCLRVHIAHSLMTKWMMQSEQKDCRINEYITLYHRQKKICNFRWKENAGKMWTKKKSTQIMFTVGSNGIAFLALMICAVERFNRMKTRNKMASRANKENRKKSTATPIACNTRSTYTIR